MPAMTLNLAPVRWPALPVALDARYHLAAYAKSGVTSATPNEAELEALHHTTIGQNLEELARSGRATLDAMKLRALLVTRGRDGMAIISGDDTQVRIIPTYAREVYDVSGAGDTVIATLATLMGAHADISSAVRIANRAAGIVVGKLGTAVVHPDELA